MRNAGGGGTGIHDRERGVDVEQNEKSKVSKALGFKGIVRFPALLVACVLTIFTSSQGILTTLSQTDGGYTYDYGTVPLLAELLKLGVSAFLLWKEKERGGPLKMTKDWRSIRLFPFLTKRESSIVYILSSRRGPKLQNPTETHDHDASKQEGVELLLHKSATWSRTVDLVFANFVEAVNHLQGRKYRSQLRHKERISSWHRRDLS